MFVNYYGTTKADEVIQLAKMDETHQLIIVSVQVYSGTNGGILTLRKKDGTEVAFQQQISILANSPMVLQHKILLPRGFSLQMTSNVSDIQVCLNGVKESV